MLPSISPKLFVLKRDRMVEGIALAEGYLVRDGNALLVNDATKLPVRCNNPVDLEVGDLGCGTVAGKTRFVSPAAGWARLRAQVTAILTGRSHAGYRVTDNFLELAHRYTGGDQYEEWAGAVARHCGMEVLDTLSQYLAAPVGFEPEFAIPEIAPPGVQTPAPGTEL